MPKFNVGDLVRVNDNYWALAPNESRDVNLRKVISTDYNSAWAVTVSMPNSTLETGRYHEKELDLVVRAEADGIVSVSHESLIAALLAVFPDETIHDGQRLTKAQVGALNRIIFDAKQLV